MHPLQATLRRGFARPLGELREELDRLWAPLTAAPPLHGWGSAERSSRFPALNLSETEDSLIVEAEIPGISSEQVEVTVHGDELQISGSRPHRQAPAEGETAVWHRQERGTGSFERSLSLPVSVDSTLVEAHLANGVLRVTCPKAAAAKPQKIRVTAS